MRLWIIGSLCMLCLSGCASAPPAPVVPSITTHNSKVTAVESGGTSRTEEYARSSHSDASGSQASTLQSAQQRNPNGTVSAHSSRTSAASSDTLGYSQDEHHISITGANVTHRFAVSGEDVAVSGQGGNLTFTGHAHGLSITGNDNNVEVESPTLVEVSGDRNHVRYTGTRPVVKVSGRQDSVEPR